MSRDLLLYLEDMLEAASKATRYVGEMTFEQFVANELVFDAVVRNLEIIGEAARHVPDEMRERYPDVPWSKLVGFRNVLAHAYADLDEALIWDTIINKLPSLVAQVQTMIDA
jgi:uncharacterized protein with HEPN domain